MIPYLPRTRLFIYTDQANFSARGFVFKPLTETHMNTHTQTYTHNNAHTHTHTNTHLLQKQGNVPVNGRQEGSKDQHIGST